MLAAIASTRALIQAQAIEARGGLRPRRGEILRVGREDGPRVAPHGLRCGLEGGVLLGGIRHGQHRGCLHGGAPESFHQLTEVRGVRHASARRLWGRQGCVLAHQHQIVTVDHLVAPAEPEKVVDLRGLATHDAGGIGVGVGDDAARDLEPSGARRSPCRRVRSGRGRP